MNSIKIYLINLKKRVDRLNDNLLNNPFKNYEIIYGFDGKNINGELSDEINLMKKFNLGPGEIGCFISHLRIYKKIVENNIGYALILEDDNIFCNDFMIKFKNIIDDKKSSNVKFDILYIGGRFTPNYTMNECNCTKISSNIVKHNKRTANRMEFDRTTSAYIISITLGKYLLDSFENEFNINLPIDKWILHLLEDKYPIYSTCPLLCYSPLNNIGDI